MHTSLNNFYNLLSNVSVLFQEINLKKIRVRSIKLFHIWKSNVDMKFFEHHSKESFALIMHWLIVQCMFDMFNVDSKNY